MENHDAPGQMAGYLYQVLSALLLILDGREGLEQICVEKFDDIAFIDVDQPRILIQTKHQLNARGSLNDTSTDFWRSINSWCDSINALGIDTEKTRFVIITTAIAPDNSASSFLCDNEVKRNAQKAYELIMEAAQGEQQTTKKFRENFLNLDKSKRKQLVSNMYVFSNSNHITEYRNELKRRIKWGTLPQYEDLICEQLEGWWFQKAIQFLCSDKTVYIHQRQVQTKIFDIASNYRADSLPITVNEFLFPSDEDLTALGTDTQIFIEQLRLIALSDDRMKRAVRDYYHAYQQRAKWVREDLLYLDELEGYETRLVDEWHRQFSIVKEELDECGGINESTKVKMGKSLYNSIENLDIYIRERVTQPFVMRGTYHDLANKLRLGWHIDFYERLCYLLKGDSV